MKVRAQIGFRGGGNAGPGRMGASQRELKAAPRGQGPPAAFNAEGGFVVHPLLRPATVAAREQDLEAAARAVETASLVVVRRSTDAWPLTLLVAAERLRQAGGFALVVASTASAVKQRAQAFRRALTDEAADRVEGVSAGTAKAERERAFERAWGRRVDARSCRPRDRRRAPCAWPLLPPCR